VHITRVARQKHQLSVRVWIGLLSDHIISYLHSLFAVPIDKSPLTHVSMWFIRDQASEFSACQVYEWWTVDSHRSGLYLENYGTANTFIRRKECRVYHRFYGPGGSLALSARFSGSRTWIARDIGTIAGIPYAPC
jgi:hypothetical protein